MTVKFEGKIYMGPDAPDLVWRRVQGSDGRPMLELLTQGQIGTKGSSMNAIYITTSTTREELALSAPGIPHMDSVPFVRCNKEITEQEPSQ
jgi:hypothetical protein